MKRFMSKKMKFFLSILAVISIGCYISAAIVLYNSDFKIANYVPRWNENSDFDFDFDFHSGKCKELGSIEKEFSSDLENININTSSADIKVEFYTGESLKITGRLYALGDMNISDIIKDVSSLNNTLSMDITPYSYDNLKLDIFIPDSYKGNLNINSTGGDNQILGGELNNLSLKSTSGEFLINNLTLKDLSVKTSSGDIELLYVNSNISNLNTTSGDIETSVCNLGELNSSSSSGEIDLNLSSLGNNSKISSTSGDIELSISESIGYTLTFNTSSGNIESNRLPIKFINDNNYSINTGDSSKNVEIKTSSGDLYIG